MDNQKIHKLLQMPEDLKLEFKEDLYKIFHTDGKVRRMHWDEFTKDVLALVNGNIGVAEKTAYLIIGVTDTLTSNGSREIHGVGNVQLNSTMILDKINSSCNPPIPIIQSSDIHLNGERIIVISIPPTPYIHETTRRFETSSGATFPENTIFIRRGETVHVASESERHAIQIEKQNAILSNKRDHSFEELYLLPENFRKHRETLSAIPRYRRWADKSLDESFIQSSGIHLPIYASPYDDFSGKTDELLECIRSYSRLLVLGEPGMGKTVALERAVWEYSNHEDDILPVYVPLIQYDGNLADIIVTALNETKILSINQFSNAKQLINSHSCVFFFDGLNEVTKVHRNHLFKELSTFLRSFSKVRCIITSRSQDTLWRRFHSRDFIESAIVVHKITDDQITEYLVAHLGKNRGKELFDRLNKALLGLARTPLLLWLIKEAGEAGEELPGNRGKLYDRFVKQVLAREEKQPTITTVPLHKKIQALSSLAFYLQKANKLTCNRNEASHIINTFYEDIDSDLVIDEAVQNGLLIGETHLNFMHQTIQEYFAALELDTLISSLQTHQSLKAPWKNDYTSIKALYKQIRKWVKEDWWSEVFIQLAGIAQNPNIVISEILISNPWLSYWCSIEGQVLKEDLQFQIEEKTVNLLNSRKVNDRVRVISELARMENPRTISFLVKALNDDSNKVQEVAIKTLVRLGEPSVNPAIDYLASAKEKGRFAATRTLSQIWHFPELAGLGAEDQNVRCNTAETLGILCDDRSLVPLIAALEDTNESVRRNVAEALGKLGDLQATDPLMKALGRSYAKSLTYESSIIGQALKTLSQKSNTTLQFEAKESSTDLVSDDVKARREAAVKLGELSDVNTAEALKFALWDQDQLVRWGATKALGKIWNIEGLMELGNSNNKIRRNAAKDLGNLMDTRVVEPLIVALQDKDQIVRKNTAESLGAIGDISIGRLATLLSHKDKEIRRGAGRALAAIGGNTASTVLANALLLDHRSWVRETAAEALSKMGDQALHHLAEAIQHSDPDIRLIARTAIRRIGTTKAQSVLRFGLDE